MRIKSIMLCVLLITPIQSGLASEIDISKQPLISGNLGAKPNLMLMFDDSTSMRKQFTPDWIMNQEYLNPLTGLAINGEGGYQLCYKSLDGLTPNSSLNEWTKGRAPCFFGDVFTTSPHINTQYYNPAQRYAPPVRADTTSYPAMTSALTDGWKQVPTDGFGVYLRGPIDFDNVTTDVKTWNLISGFPARVWCQSQSDSASDIEKCKRNFSLDHPSPEFPYGHSVTGDVKYRLGGPYYYLMSGVAYCSDEEGRKCVVKRATGKFCEESPSSVGVCYDSPSAFPIQKKVRFCKSGSDLSDCMDTRSTELGYTHPYFLGSFGPGGQNLGTATYCAAGPCSAGAAGSVPIQTNLSGGRIQVVDPFIAYDGESFEQRFSSFSISKIEVDGVNLIGGPGVAKSFGSGSDLVQVAVDGTILASRNSTSAGGGFTARSNIADAIVYAINQRSAITGYIAGRATNGSSARGTSSSAGIVVTKQGGAPTKATWVTYTPGLGTNNPKVLKVFATKPFPEAFTFERIDISPAITSYPKAIGRTDCKGATCSYEEEMTNFANWFAYYRSRLQAMKVGIGKAFEELDDSYRVGFITLNPSCAKCAERPSRYHSIQDFNPDQRDGWYKKLYATDGRAETPLREALSRVGRMYAGKLSGISEGFDNPVQASCQVNYTILSTDGYWNGPSGLDLNGGPVGNQDNVNSGLSSMDSGAWDGGLAGASDTLADVAMYYYKTDLRPDMPDNVEPTAKDPATHQHMTTFTVGFGMAGSLRYRHDYDTSATGDFQAIRAGVKKWPVPVAEKESALDDLWHAAVNGRGRFYSAQNPETLAWAFSDLIGRLQQAKKGSGTGVAVPGIEVTESSIGFRTKYQTVDWFGDVTAHQITSSGELSSKHIWSAAANLDSRDAATRTIFTFDPGAATGRKLKSFCGPTLDAIGCGDLPRLDGAQLSLFDTSGFSGYSSWTEAKKKKATNEALIAYLRGDKSLYDLGGGGDAEIFRLRQSILGDVVNAEPRYLKDSRLKYDETVDKGYTQFASKLANRQAMLYVAANDGMLHAFNADSGEEVWSYVPGPVLGRIRNLADVAYKHEYLLDATPTLSDFCLGSSPSESCWRSILVGAIGLGGRGIYALDITDPSPSKVSALWEFTDGPCLSDSEANSGTAKSDCLGVSNASPIVTKLPGSSQWVVIFSSGYNNPSGQGYLYILDASTGKLKRRISTGAGSPSSQSGLGKLNGWAKASSVDNTTLSVYAGDVLGNLWRFGLDPANSSDFMKAVRVAELVGPNGEPQPITTTPLLTEIKGRRLIIVSTGKYLGVTDSSNIEVQSVYGLIDDPSTSSNPVSREELIEQTLSSDQRVLSSKQVDLESKRGWFVDLPEKGERVNVDMRLALGTVVVASNAPTSKADVCMGSTAGWLTFLDFETGGSLKSPGSSYVDSVKVSNSGVVGTTVQITGSGPSVLYQRGDGSDPTRLQFPGRSSSVAGRKVSWRELTLH